MAELQGPAKEPQIEIHPYDLLAMGPDDEEYDPTIWARGSIIKVGVTIPCLAHMFLQ